MWGGCLHPAAADGAVKHQRDQTVVVEGVSRLHRGIPQAVGGLSMDCDLISLALLTNTIVASFPLGSNTRRARITYECRAGTTPACSCCRGYSTPRVPHSTRPCATAAGPRAVGAAGRRPWAAGAGAGAGRARRMRPCAGGRRGCHPGWRGPGPGTAGTSRPL